MLPQGEKCNNSTSNFFNTLLLMNSPKPIFTLLYPILPKKCQESIIQYFIKEGIFDTNQLLLR